MATTPEASPLVEAYFQAAHLKQLYRQGWLRRGVAADHCESVADHSYGTALLAMLLADAVRPDLDAGKVLRLALLHDLGEVHAGDLIPSDGVTDGDKHEREAIAVRRVLAGVPGSDRHVALWEEYEAQQTPEARFVRQVDRLEMALQAAVYEAQGHADLTEFLESARRDVDDPALTPLLDELARLRGEGN